MTRRGPYDKPQTKCSISSQKKKKTIFCSPLAIASNIYGTSCFIVFFRFFFSFFCLEIIWNSIQKKLIENIYELLFIILFLSFLFASFFSFYCCFCYCCSIFRFDFKKTYIVVGFHQQIQIFLSLFIFFFLFFFFLISIENIKHFLCFHCLSCDCTRSKNYRLELSTFGSVAWVAAINKSVFHINFLF